MDIGALRREYTQAGLNKANLAANPFSQFETWFQQANQAHITEVNAMQIATSTAQGKPSLRTVLLKAFDEQGFVFYTNYHSQKAQQITENPQVAALFFWKELERQVEITGRVEKVSTLESLKYFTSRPRGSQLGAWVSAQSSIISSRKLLEAKLEEMKLKFSHGEIPLPDFWGGFRIIPDTVEFWQGRPNRLHDRFEYRLTEQNSWQIERLSP
ncbi:pyridoxamine 5'-phosphate oxidase [uncultured Thiothrix sp.]|jgi:pyridoxamine 5'-phosphate oxidase|uniref:pyridoxamine 5'-phosphate oxidase n=1 Tax=uncultured Thiothrix sp. TaxID=223185 RepID=UPI00260AAEB9|nr:pyridoxamine 5'-phosphate oxidase [uncultured Thiothrix sp.]HMT92368.1 pyridoxamine 5'-phosphate oxidase [Thiolinea sp.]